MRATLCSSIQKIVMGCIVLRDRCCWSNKETKIIYFRSPNQWNLHDTDRVPKEGEDGWMEVIVWRFNSYCDNVHVNLKLKTYEGSMSGLIVYGLEFRPIYEFRFM